VKKTRNYHDDLIKRLKNVEFALGYLNACLDEKEACVFLLGLRIVAQAHGGLKNLSKSTGLNREHLFRMLSKQGNPRLDNLRILADNFGWKLAFVKKNENTLRKAA